MTDSKFFLAVISPWFVNKNYSINSWITLIEKEGILNEEPKVTNIFFQNLKVQKYNTLLSDVMEEEIGPVTKATKNVKIIQVFCESKIFSRFECIFL